MKIGFTSELVRVNICLPLIVDVLWIRMKRLDYEAFPGARGSLYIFFYLFIWQKLNVK